MPDKTMMVKVLSNFTIPNFPEFQAGEETQIPAELARELLSRNLVAPLVVNVENLEGEHENEHRASKKAAK